MLVRHRSRLATVGLAVVLVLLAGFSLWASTQTRAAARHVDRDSAEQQGWQTARLELAEAQAAQHSYVRQIPKTPRSPARWRATISGT